jgi:two-component sensor histidine kinase
MALLDEQFRIVEANASFTGLAGQVAEVPTGRPFTEAMPDLAPVLLPLLQQSQRSGEALPGRDINVEAGYGGQSLQYAVAAEPVCPPDGPMLLSLVIMDVTARAAAEVWRGEVMAELNHRVKNTLATVQAIARQSFRSGPLDSRARETFEARLQALSRAHDLLTRENWDGTDMASVVAQVLAPYQRQRFEIGGPELRLTPRVALALTLALHELATNAAKYGALSVPTGRVTITWTVRPSDPPHLALRWQERSGPPVSPPSQKGFGSRLIERSLALELAGEVHISYEPNGVLCDISAPLPAAWNNGVEAA